MPFEQAGIEVQKVAEFQSLKAAIERAFAPGQVENFLGVLQGRNVRVRDWHAVLAKGLLEKSGALAKGASARKLYDGLSTSDQGLIREAYLVALEQVDPALRQKFYRIYVSY